MRGITSICRRVALFSGLIELTLCGNFMLEQKPGGKEGLCCVDTWGNGGQVQGTT